MQFISYSKSLQVNFHPVLKYMETNKLPSRDEINQKSLSVNIKYAR